jgi:hypothetical protein
VGVRRMWGHSRTTYLTGSINDLGRKLLVLIPDDFAEGVLDSRIVALDKVTVDELHRQA